MPDQPTGGASPSPIDQAARSRVAADLGTTLFVEAGAGSGKTTALIDRVEALITTGAVELQEVAAITFTEKAAAELRDRIRQRLEATAAHHGDRVVVERCRIALDQLDGAAIGTLHSFARRILSEHPVEAGLPPRVEVLDEVTSGVEFEQRWAAFRDELLEDPALKRTLLLLRGAGVTPAALLSLARSFDRNWDLVDEQVPAAADEPPPFGDLLAPALDTLVDLCAERDGCSDREDKLCVALDAIASHGDRLRAIDDEIDLLEALGDDADPPVPSYKVGNVGQQQNWAGAGITSVRSKVTDAHSTVEAARSQLTTACAHRIGSEIRRFTLGGAEQRRATGRLEFHDLLVLARALLRDETHGATVRTALHRRYRRLLLDEFQDTDPIQIELAVRIAAADPASPDAGSLPWPDVPIAPGHLFVVGDPKQSIYRFRRADIRVFLEARDRLDATDGGLVELTANFRTVAPVIEWVNSTFAQLMQRPPDIELAEPAQPDYVGLAPTRSGPPAGPAVAVLGRQAHPPKTSAGTVRAAEAAEVADSVLQAIAGRWSVHDGPNGWRPARLGDIAILVPARTSLPFLEEALEMAGVPYRAESSSLVYATRAVRDLLMVLRAVDDPTDHLRVVSALRTPLFGCGDDDLFRFKVERAGRWSYLADQPASVPADDPVRAGLEAMAELHRERTWLVPSELLDRIARSRRAMELGFAEGRPRDLWRRVRFVVDQARAWHEATGGSLREYLHWVEQQTAEGARVAEAVLPETDDDAVRIMTIHAAKGLEFPITIVSGMSTLPQSRLAAGEARFSPTEGVSYRFNKQVVTPEFTERVPVDEQMDAMERIRLLYVATTRAQDHLVMSLHRAERKKAPPLKSSTNAELLVTGMGDLLAEVPDAVDHADRPLPPLPSDGALPVDPPPPYEQWSAERNGALNRASRATAVAATALTDEGRPDSADADGAEASAANHTSSAETSGAGETSGAKTSGADADGAETSVADKTSAARETSAVDERAAGLQKRPRDLDLPPWLKGRYGTTVGRAVHGVLQSIDLATGDGLDDAVAAQCQAEAATDREDDVRRLVRHALGSPSVREAATTDHWREVYACVPVAGRLLEGYVDLLYRADAGLVVVDYKTAATTNATELDRRVQEYRFQGASYALVLGAATDERVARVTFVFLTPDGAVERHLDDLDVAVREVEAVVARGAELEMA